jgi:peptide/nickel transport system ATP-binding protein
MAAPLLTIQGLVKHFPLKKDVLGRGGGVVRAVDGVDFHVMPGETLGVVGESGCGKSTTARLLMHLIEPTAGEVVFEGRKVGSRDLPLKEYRRQVQMVFQDSYASLNPRLTIEDSIAFGPQVHGVPTREAVERARSLLAKVGLEPGRFAERYPHELSGGQRQRVNIARALALQPRVVILDEAVSALDKSVEAQVLNLLLDLKDEFGLTYVFISHDLNLVASFCDRILVMYAGRVVEACRASELHAATHPYTRGLLESLPRIDDDRAELPTLRRDPAWAAE